MLYTRQNNDAQQQITGKIYRKAMNILHTKVEVSYRLVDYDRYIDESQDKIKQHLMAISTDSD